MTISQKHNCIKRLYAPKLAVWKETHRYLNLTLKRDINMISRINVDIGLRLGIKRIMMMDVRRKFRLNENQ